MIVVFAGPSLYGADIDRKGIEFLGPARQGDILKAALGGATTIGLIDGVFGSAAAVWHKEILHALSLDIHVLGAASMGALRAAECALFGMEPVGKIANRYLSGELDDDAAVALTFGPPEMGYCPLSETLVDLDDKLATTLGRALISKEEAEQLSRTARSIFYADRTLYSICTAAFGEHRKRGGEVFSLLERLSPSLKQRDAIALIERVRQPCGISQPRRWKLAEPAYWREVVRRSTSGAADRVTLLSR